MDKSTAGRHMSLAAREARHASTELCQVIESLICAAAVPPASTLSEVRKAVLDGIFIGNGEMLYPQDRTFLVSELDELIERDGAQTPARDYAPGRLESSFSGPSATSV